MPTNHNEDFKKLCRQAKYAEKYEKKVLTNTLYNKLMKRWKQG
jgi:predicted nucleic-acid-binding Zn-ribbon protein